MRRHILLVLLLIIGILILSSFVYAETIPPPNDEGWVGLWFYNASSGDIQDIKTNSRENYNLSCTGVTYQQTSIDSVSDFAINFSDGGFCENAPIVSELNKLNSTNWTIIHSVFVNDTDNAIALEFNDDAIRFNFNLDNGGTLMIIIEKEGGGDYRLIYTDVDPREKNLFLVLIRNGTTTYLYNGTEFWAKTTDAVGYIPMAPTGLFIGCDHAELICLGGGSKTGFTAIYDKALNITQIQDLITNGFVAAQPGAPVTPTYQFPTPADNSFNNTNQTINCTTTDPTTNLRFFLNVSLTGGNTDMPYLFNVSATGEGHRIFATNFSDGAYLYECFLQNITNGLFSNSASRTLTIDTVTPTITINQNNAFNTSNISSQNQYLNFMFLNITFNDETGLFGILINVTQDGVSYFNHTNTSMNNVLVHNFTRNISTVLWPDGVFDIEITVADGSTLFSIEDYAISGFLSRITFDTYEGNKIDIISSGALSTEYTKEKDRYEFGFNYLTKETTRKFTVKCNNELFYMDNPKKAGHFVCWNERRKKGNWIDFGGIGNDYVIKKITDKEYDITFSNLPSSNHVLIKSIGGLNVVTENYQWFKGSTTNIFSSIATSGFEQSFKINITLDFDLVKNITAGFSYNKTIRTVTRTDSSSSILFDSTFIVPDVNETLNLSWTLNVTQRNDGSYIFSVNESQELISPQVNLTILDEENQTLIKEDLTIFFTGPTSLQKNTSSGTLSVGNLVVGEYFIQAEGATYPRRGIFFTITNVSANLNLYLVKDITGNNFIDYIVQDDGRNRLNNVRLTFQKSINNSFVTVAQLETDFAGQGRIFQDQQNEYRIVMFLTGFATQTIDLIPLLTSYTLTLSTLAEQLFETTYEGIRYTISPAARVLNASGNFEDISFTIFDSTSSLEFFGLQIINHSYTCIPANCITNISGSPAGGTAVVQVKLNFTGSFDTLYFFKRNGFPLQFINGQRSSVRLLIGDRLADNFKVIGDNLGTPVMRSIFAAILITVLAVLASQIGIVGLGLMLVISFGTIFFMLLGFIPRMVAMITLFFGVSIYFVLGSET